MIHPVTVQSGKADSLPVTLSEVKEHLRVSHSDDDSYITSLISVALSSVEKQTRRACVRKTVIAWFTHWASQYERYALPLPPYIETTSTNPFLAYYDTDDNLIAIPAHPTPIATEGNLKNVIVEKDLGALESGCAFVSLKAAFAKPSLTKNREGRIRFQYKAGYDSTTFPAALKQAVFLMCAHFYDTREPVAFNATPMMIQKSVDYLCDQYKVGRH